MNEKIFFTETFPLLLLLFGGLLIIFELDYDYH